MQKPPSALPETLTEAHARLALPSSVLSTKLAWVSKGFVQLETQSDKRIVKKSVSFTTGSTASLPGVDLSIFLHHPTVIKSYGPIISTGSRERVRS